MKYAYINGKILDGSENMKPQEKLVVLTEGEKIEALAPADTDLTGYEIIDLKGQYLMP